MRAYARNIVSFCLFFFLHISCLSALYAQQSFLAPESYTLGSDPVSVSIDAQRDSRAVDLGLPIYWADRNVGASSPTDAGGYFAWGETVSRTSDFKLTSYSLYETWRARYTKYANFSYLNRNGIILLELEDDAARQNWGGNWRMPSKLEAETMAGLGFSEVNNCYVVVGNSDTVTFCKTSYYIQTGRRPGDESNRAYFWTSQLAANISEAVSVGYAYAFSIDNPTTWYTYVDWRYYGLPIRPVINKRTLTIKIENSGSVTESNSYNFPEGTAVQLTATPTDDCYKFVQWSDGNTDNPRSITVTSNAEYQAVFSLKTASITLTSDGNGTVEFDD